MASIEAICKSPYYFGDISLEETKKILLQEPPHSYLYRRLINGSITLATLRFQSKSLFELEVKNCNCDGTLINIQRFKSLDGFIQQCNFVCVGLDLGSPNIFKLPVKRKNVLSLQEKAKLSAVKYFPNSIAIMQKFNGVEFY